MFTRREMLASALAAGAVAVLAPLRTRAAEPPVFIGKDGWLFPSWEHETGIGAKFVASGIHDIVRTHALFARHNVRLYISMVPSKSRVYREFLPSNVKVAPEFISRYHNALAAFKKAGVPATNCLDPMLAGKKRHLLFMKSDSHWTGYGSHIAARATAKTVGIPAERPNPLPDGVPIPGKVWELEINGDLVPMIPPALQKNYPPDPLMVTDFTLQGGVAPAIYDVAVVGTSASKENLGFSQTFANAIAKPVDLYWDLGSIGQWKMLTQYFAKTKAEGKPLPKTLVWQFSDYVLGAGPEAVGAWGKENAYPSVDAFLSSLNAVLKR